MTDFLSKWKWQLLAFAGILVLACTVFFAASGWAIYRLRKPAEPTNVPDTFGYCGADLTDLCIVSFGRDVFGDTVVNLYVPVDEYPAFYLNIVRRSGDVRYDCTWNKTVETSVYCTGDPLNLEEGIQIQIFSVENDSLLAQGDFLLTAFFVTTSIVEGDKTATETSEGDSELTSTPTSTSRSATKTPTPTKGTDSLEAEDETPTPTNTSSSYPSYP